MWKLTYISPDTVETYFDSHVDLLQRRLLKHSDRLKMKAEEVFRIRDLNTDSRFDLFSGTNPAPGSRSNSNSGGPAPEERRSTSWEHSAAAPTANASDLRAIFGTAPPAPVPAPPAAGSVGSAGNIGSERSSRADARIWCLTVNFHVRLLFAFLYHLCPVEAV
ncbi:hypothetical protein GALMADRAFT_146001 [Galerina marginata CBS 339.88]|uniref:Uncharacterized protein n=1 Tax=Galerina marginata (strain CBS 339.88) TaxID=685588 RepID=A0A067SDN1_GALM3|nr:hypothetical protein GALMADRAFT_146001 [Galerina marginata CBS 339.88]